jgi:uncharacterized membrane protein
MAAVLALIGLRIGLNPESSDVKGVAWASGLMAVAAICMFAGHFAALWLLRSRYQDDELLRVASMCCIGGFSTAPIVAANYGEEIIEPTYVCVLVLNVLSIPLTLLVIKVLSSWQ